MARAALTTAAAADYLALLDEAADRAAAATGGYRDRCFSVARHVVRVRFAGPALVAEVARSMRHIEVAPTESPSLTIRVWDSASTGIPLPVRPGTDDGAARRRFGDDELSFVQWAQDSLSAVDVPRDAAHFWVEDPERTLRHQRAAPLSPILAAWLPSRGVLHPAAGAVGTKAGCVLLAGSSGSGKSTAALASAAAGIGYLGDDACLLGPELPPVVHSLYESIQLTPDTVGAVAALGPVPASRPADDKAIFHVAEHAPERLLVEAPLRGIAVLEIAGRPETRTAPMSAAATVASIAPPSIFRLPAPRPAVFRRLAEIADSVPCHRLAAGTDPERLAAAVEALL